MPRNGTRGHHMPALPYEKVSDCVEKVKARWDGIDLDGAHGRCRVIA